VIAKQFDDIEAFFRRCIRAGQADKTISRDVDAADPARLFLGVLLGVRVLARTNPDRAILEGVVRPALALLDEPRRNRRKQ
jgi:TetR/AcrR family transcriptional repressor of nem operon